MFIETECTGRRRSAWPSAARARPKSRPSGPRISSSEPPAKFNPKPIAPSSWAAATTLDFADALRRAAYRLRRHGARSDLQPALPRHHRTRRANSSSFSSRWSPTSREELLALAAKYRRAESVGARLRNGVDAQPAGIPLPGHRPRQSPSLPGTRQQSALSQSAACACRPTAARATAWGNPACGATESPAICPCSAVIVGDPRGMPLVRELLLAHTYWRMRGFRADLDRSESGEPQLRSPAAPAACSA